MKELEKLAYLELKKNEHEKELENSLVEIEKMSALLKKLKRVKITECKQVEAEKKIDNIIPRLKYEKDLPNIDWLKSKPPLTDTKNNCGQKDRKLKKNVTAYKQYTSGDIFAALEEVKKGKSALQVSKQFNIPSRTLYYRAKKMGITLSRNMRRMPLAKNYNAAYFHPRTSMHKLLGRNGSKIGVEEGIQYGQDSCFNFQGIFVENLFKDFRESDWTFLV